MNLCTFSKSEVLYNQILSRCPLQLSSTAAKHCPCRQRRYHVPPADLRVLSCEYPNTWNGERISDPAAVKGNIKKRIAKSKPPKPPKPPKQPKPVKPKEEKTVTTEASPVSPDKTALMPSIHPTPTAMTVYDRVADPLEFINKIGQTLYGSKMFGCANVDQGRALAFGFLTNKLDPFSWKARHHIIGGSITMSAEAMLADFRTGGGEHTIISRTPERAAVELRHGKKKQIFEFTWAQAQTEDYVWNSEAAKDHRKRYLPDKSLNYLMLKDNYKTPRRRMQMLWSRVIADGVGAMMPEVSSGRQTPEELGVISSDIQADVIDAEFEVVPPSTADNAAATEAASDAAATADHPAAPPSDEIAVPDATSAPAPQPSPVEPTPSGPTPEQLAAEQEKASHMALLQDLKKLKDELEISTEKWQATLTKYNVKSARELPSDILVGMISKMQGALEARRAKAGTDPVSQWANNVVSGGTQADLAAQGN